MQDISFIGVDLKSILVVITERNGFVLAFSVDKALGDTILFLLKLADKINCNWLNVTDSGMLLPTEIH